MTIVEKYWDDAREGDTCVSPSYTVTKERILAYADLTGDHTPVHVDEAYANASHFGCIVAHGLFGLSIADGLKTQSDYRFLPGMSLGWTWDFLLPVKDRYVSIRRFVALVLNNIPNAALQEIHVDRPAVSGDVLEARIRFDLIYKGGSS